MARRCWRMVMLALGLGAVGFGPCGERDRYRTVFSDDFDGPAGQSPDPTRWGFDVGTGAGGWGNGQLEYDTARPENASLDGEGHLVLTARREAYQGSAYTSARMVTRGRLERRYGRFEARIKLPRGQGIWPALWLLGADHGTNTWPACGEIDVMEYRGQEPGRVTGSVHGPGYSAGQAITGSRTLPDGAGFDEAFHVFGVEWTPDWVAWELDGQVWQVLVPEALPDGGRWVFDHPFYLILNLAVGGGYVGPPDPATFPAGGVEMRVDWVRVQERVP